jgi:hypothetical protein
MFRALPPGVLGERHPSARALKDVEATPDVDSLDVFTGEA